VFGLLKIDSDTGLLFMDKPLAFVWKDLDVLSKFKSTLKFKIFKKYLGLIMSVGMISFGLVLIFYKS
jgi:hypothetical protein